MTDTEIIQLSVVGAIITVFIWGLLSVYRDVKKTQKNIR